MRRPERGRSPDPERYHHDDLPRGYYSNDSGRRRSAPLPPPLEPSALYGSDKRGRQMDDGWHTRGGDRGGDRSPARASSGGVPRPLPILQSMRRNRSRSRSPPPPPPPSQFARSHSSGYDQQPGGMRPPVLDGPPPRGAVAAARNAVRGGAGGEGGGAVAAAAPSPAGRHHHRPPGGMRSSAAQILPPPILNSALHPDIKELIASLVDRRVMEVNDILPSNVQALQLMPIALALQALDEFAGLDRKRINHPAAFLNGILKRFMQGKPAPGRGSATSAAGAGTWPSGASMGSGGGSLAAQKAAARAEAQHLKAAGSKEAERADPLRQEDYDDGMVDVAPRARARVTAARRDDNDDDGRRQQYEADRSERRSLPDRHVRSRSHSPVDASRRHVMEEDELQQQRPSYPDSGDHRRNEDGAAPVGRKRRSREAEADDQEQEQQQQQQQGYDRGLHHDSKRGAGLRDDRLQARGSRDDNDGDGHRDRHMSSRQELELPPPPPPAARVQRGSPADSPLKGKAGSRQQLRDCAAESAADAARFEGAHIARRAGLDREQQHNDAALEPARKRRSPPHASAAAGVPPGFGGAARGGSPPPRDDDGYLPPPSSSSRSAAKDGSGFSWGPGGAPGGGSGRPRGGVGGGEPMHSSDLPRGGRGGPPLMGDRDRGFQRESPPLLPRAVGGRMMAPMMMPPMMMERRGGGRSPPRGADYMGPPPPHMRPIPMRRAPSPDLYAARSVPGPMGPMVRAPEVQSVRSERAPIELAPRVRSSARSPAELAGSSRDGDRHRGQDSDRDRDRRQSPVRRSSTAGGGHRAVLKSVAVVASRTAADAGNMDVSVSPPHGRRHASPVSHRERDSSRGRDAAGDNDNDDNERGGVGHADDMVDDDSQQVAHGRYSGHGDDSRQAGTPQHDDDDNRAEGGAGREPNLLDEILDGWDGEQGADDEDAAFDMANLVDKKQVQQALRT